MAKAKRAKKVSTKTGMKGVRTAADTTVLQRTAMRVTDTGAGFHGIREIQRSGGRSPLYIQGGKGGIERGSAQAGLYGKARQRKGR